MPHRACSRRRRLHQGLGSALRRGVPKGPLANRHTSRALDQEKCSEARGPPKAPDQQTQLPKRWVERSDPRNGVHRRPPTNRLNSPGCGLSSFRETAHLTIGPPARNRELRLHVRTPRALCASQAGDSVAAYLLRPAASPRASGPRLCRPTGLYGSRSLGSCEQAARSLC